MDYQLYLLINTKNQYTYLGITNNSTRRLRQHNGELKGGAKYTRMKKGEGKWEYYMKIEGLTKSQALSMERTTKNYRKFAKGSTPLDKRLDAIEKMKLKYKYFYK
tara:strand:+ start:502 stop:816 length:315 start_codon:yes stop_codon:yes gene_type:complete